MRNRTVDPAKPAPRLLPPGGLLRRRIRPVDALVYGVVAARNRRAQKLLIPLLDILQSVPVGSSRYWTVWAGARTCPTWPAR